MFFQKKFFKLFFYLTSALGAGLRAGRYWPLVAIPAIAAIIFINMRKKPPGEKNVSTGVSLPPDLYEWVMNRVRQPSTDPTSARTASKIVKQALVEYRDRIEAEEREAALRAAETPSGGKAVPAQKRTKTKYLTAAEVKRAEKKRAAGAGAVAISPSASSATLSSTAGRARYPKAG